MKYTKKHLEQGSLILDYSEEEYSNYAEIILEIDKSCNHIKYYLVRSKKIMTSSITDYLDWLNDSWGYKSKTVLT